MMQNTKMNMINPPLKNLKPAKRYSKAIVNIAKEKNLDLDKMLNQIGQVMDIIFNSQELENFLLNPTVSKKDKEDVLIKVFKNRVLDEVLNLLLLLSNDNRLNILGDILSSLKNDINEIKNVSRVFVTSAFGLNENQQNLIKEKLQIKLKREIEAEFIEDDSILGGIVIKINDGVIDLSLKKKIKSLKEQK